MSTLLTSGPYFGTRGGLDLGCTDEGWFVEIIHKGEMVRFEEFGENVLDEIPLGADVYVEAVLKEWNVAGLRPALWYHSAVFGNMDCPAGGSIPKEPLILTPSACGKAGINGGTFTFHQTAMEPEVAARINLDNKIRMVPVRFRVFMTDISTSGTDGEYSYFTVS